MNVKYCTFKLVFIYKTKYTLREGYFKTDFVDISGTDAAELQAGVTPSGDRR